MSRSSDGPETTPVATFDVANRGNQSTVLRVFEQPADAPGCQYIAIQTSLISTDFGDEATYRLTADATESVKVQVRLPDRASMQSLSETEELSCRYNVTARNGATTSFLVRAAVQESFVEQVNTWTRTHLFGFTVFQDFALCLPAEDDISSITAPGFDMQDCPDKRLLQTEWAPTLPTAVIVLLVGSVVLIGLWS